MERLDNILKSGEGILDNIGGVATFVLMIFVVLQVLGRYIFKTDLIPGLYNIIESYVYTLLIFATLASSYRAGLWPKLEMFVDRMPERRARYVRITCLTIELVLYFAVTFFTLIYAIKMCAEGRQMMAGARNYPLYPMLCIVPVAFTFLCVETFLNLWRVVKKVEFEQ